MKMKFKIPSVFPTDLSSLVMCDCMQPGCGYCDRDGSITRHHKNKLDELTDLLPADENDKLVWFIELRWPNDEFAWFANEKYPMEWTSKSLKAMKFKSKAEANLYLKLNEDYFNEKIPKICRLFPTEHEFVSDKK